MNVVILSRGTLISPVKTGNPYSKPVEEHHVSLMKERYNSESEKKNQLAVLRFCVIVSSDAVGIG